MLEVLIMKGGNVNAMDKKDRRPIHWAAFMGKDRQTPNDYRMY